MICLEQALRNRWKENAELADLIPVGHVWTDWSDPTQLPRAEITCSGEDRIWLTSHSEIAERVRVTVFVWHGSFQDVRSTVDRIKEVFDRTSFDLGEGARVLRLTYRREDVSQQQPGLWRGEVIFDGLALRPVVD